MFGVELRRNAVLKVVGSRAGRFRARAVLCNKGDVADEKL